MILSIEISELVEWLVVNQYVHPLDAKTLTSDLVDIKFPAVSTKGAK